MLNSARITGSTTVLVMLAALAIAGPARAAGSDVSGGVTARVQGGILIIVDQSVGDGVVTGITSTDDPYLVESSGTETPGASCPLVDEQLRCDVSNVTRVIVFLGDGDDTFGTDTGFHYPLTVRGGDGDDVVATGNGDDVVDLGPGNDRYVFNAGGNDRVFGQAGNDVIRNNSGDFFGSGGSGNDVISGGNRTSTLLGGAGNDRLFVRDRRGGDFVNGGAGTDAAAFDGGDRVVGVEATL